MRLSFTFRKGLPLLAPLTFALLPVVAQAQYGYGGATAVNAAEAQSLAQNNAFDLNVGIQDFTFQLDAILTNLTEGTREKIAFSKGDPIYQVFLQNNVVDPFEGVRDNLRTAAYDLTRASLNFTAQTPVNVFIDQFNKISKLIDEPLYFRGTTYYRSHYLNIMAIKQFKYLLDEFRKVILLHKLAVKAAQ